jgi:hypothetical protein
MLLPVTNSNKLNIVPPRVNKITHFLSAYLVYSPLSFLVLKKQVRSWSLA